MTGWHGRGPTPDERARALTPEERARRLCELLWPAQVVDLAMMYAGTGEHGARAYWLEVADAAQLIGEEREWDRLDREAMRAYREWDMIREEPTR